MKRGILIGGGAVVAAIVIAAVVLLAGLDTIIKNAIESYGPDMTQSDVSVDEVSVSSSGEGSIKGMSVDNPEGFESQKAFSLGSIELALDTATVTEDVITIKSIAIRQPSITYEIQKGGRTNFDALMENVNAYVEALTGGAGDDGAGDTSGETAEAEGEGKKFIIEDFLLEGGEVAVVAQGLGLGEISASLPRIHMTNIGKNKGGADAGEIVQIVLAKVQNGALGAMQALDINQLNNLLKDPKALLDKGLDALNVRGEKGQAVRDAEKAYKGFKSMFGK